MKSAPQFFRDDFGIGPVKVARNRAYLCAKEMRLNREKAFSPDYMPDLVRESSLRMFDANEAEYRRAQEILKAMGEKP